MHLCTQVVSRRLGLHSSISTAVAVNLIFFLMSMVVVGIHHTARPSSKVRDYVEDYSGTFMQYLLRATVASKAKPTERRNGQPDTFAFVGIPNTIF